MPKLTDGADGAIGAFKRVWKVSWLVFVLHIQAPVNKKTEIRMKNIFLAFTALLALGAAKVEAADYKAPRAVMPGLLVGSGVPKGYGGKSLPESKLQEYCEEGFTTAFYLYPDENFTTRGRYSCRGNTLNYTGGGFRRGGEKEVQEAILDAANNGGKILSH